MATPLAVWVPIQNGGLSAALVAPGGDSGVLYMGKRQLFRIWSDGTSGISINFGLGASTPAPTNSSYSIGPIPQDFDMGDSLDSIRLVNNSGVSSAHYYIQPLSKF